MLDNTSDKSPRHSRGALPEWDSQLTRVQVWPPQNMPPKAQP
jgi:hypothetical protein